MLPGSAGKPKGGADVCRNAAWLETPAGNDEVRGAVCGPRAVSAEANEWLAMFPPQLLPLRAMHGVLLAPTPQHELHLPCADLPSVRVPPSILLIAFKPGGLVPTALMSPPVPVPPAASRECQGSLDALSGLDATSNDTVALPAARPS